MQSASDTRVEREKVQPRTNGWSCPWHPLQYVAWFFVFFFAVLHFGFLGHYVPGYWSIMTFAVPVILLAIVVLSMFMATSLDPAERSFRHKMSFRGRKISRPTYDRTKHAHVIENNYCNLCQINVSVQAKHCRVCDKCIDHFDHHCKWLNNCVGSRNYRWFLSAVWSALTSLVLLILYSASLFILFFTSTQSLRFNCKIPSNLTSCDPSFRVLGGVVPDPVFPVLCGAIVLLSLVGAGLLGHLAGFHLYLKFKGQTTYEFFTESGDSKHNSASCSCRKCGLLKKLNKVSPAPEEITATITTGVPNPIVARLTDDIITTPPDDIIATHPEETIVYRHTSTYSDDSAGMNTFGPTPPPSPLPSSLSPSPSLSPQFDGDGDDGGMNKTDEQKLGLLYGMGCDEAEENGNGNECRQNGNGNECRQNGNGDKELLIDSLLESPQLTTHPQNELLYSPWSTCYNKEEGQGEESGDDVTLPMTSLSVGDGDKNSTSGVPVLQGVNEPPVQGILNEPPVPGVLNESPVQGILNETPVLQGVLNETPGPLMSYGVPTPVSSPVNEDTSRHVSFQDLLQDETRPRPLPPIGSDILYYHDGSIPYKARRLPPLSSCDAISLTSASSSSQSQLFPRGGSTNSLPDPRYSNDPRTLAAGRRGKITFKK